MEQSSNYIKEIKFYLEPSRKKLEKHPLYLSITNSHQLKTFMEHHVFAVWDFMSLVKSLQVFFTTVSLPWKPPTNPQIARLINEIVLDEESDIDKNGKAISHFEMYIDAMSQFGADISFIQKFLKTIDKYGLDFALENFSFSKHVKSFMKTTFSFVNSGSIHEIASVFTFGREEIIPEIFLSVIKNLNYKQSDSVQKFIYYLERHIELDGEKHAELCFQMLSIICGDDLIKWEQAKLAAKKAMDSRILLWDGICEKVNSLEVT